MSTKRTKELSELKITDDFMFGAVATNTEFSKMLIESVLKKDIGEIARISKQNVIDDSFRGKGVRLDVYLQGSDGTLYDLEMQNKNEKDLYRRMRLYHSIIDRDALAKGESYEEIKDAYVIFFCMDDPSGFDKMVRAIDSTDRDTGCTIENGSKTYIVVINHKDQEQEKEYPELAALIDYMRDDSVCDQNSPLVKMATELVSEVKKNDEWGSKYMLYSANEIFKAKAYREEGRDEYADKLKKLKDRLVSMGKIEDILRSIDDRSYAQELFRKYDIT